MRVLGKDVWELAPLHGQARARASHVGAAPGIIYFNRENPAPTHLDFLELWSANQGI